MEPKKIIVKVWDDVPLNIAALLVGKVIEGGRISAKDSFCSATTFTGFHVYADRTKAGTDVFQVCRNK